MGNKLRKIFNNSEITYNGKISFNSKNAIIDFKEALESVYKTGEAVSVDGITKMSWGINNGSGILPIDDFDNVTDVIVGPSFERNEIQVKVDGKNVGFTIESCRLEKRIIVRTPLDFPFEMRMVFNSEKKTVKLNYTPHIERATSVEELLAGIKKINALFDYFFIKDTDGTDSDYDNIKSRIYTFIDLFDKLSYVEQLFRIKFDVKTMDLNDESSYRDLYEICLLVREKRALHVNGKMTSEGGIEIHNESGKDLEIDRPLILTFLKETTYNVWNQECKLYCAFFVGNAIVKDIVKLENGESRVMYGDNETKPMFLAYKGYVNEDDANNELKNLMSHKEEYENAKTAEQYWIESQK